VDRSDHTAGLQPSAAALESARAGRLRGAKGQASEGRAMFSIIRRDTGFFDLFDRASNILVQCAEAYADVVKDYSQRDDYISRIRQFEHDGDEIVHRTLEKLDTTFITPFDREDIQALLKRMDDVIDDASKRLMLYQIKEPSTWLVKQTDILVRATKLVAECVRKLRNLRRLNGLQDQLVEVHRLENMGDDNNHSAVAELYATTTDPILAMKWKEIYDLTERAIDRCEDIANTIEGIVLKNT
jgi:uncharacterized protein Yka (UPF0111/DUF47 family)